MKRALLLGCTLLSTMTMSVIAQSPDPTCSPTPTPTPGPTPSNNNPPDPAFINNDPKPSKSGRISPVREAEATKLTPADQQAWQTVFLQLEKSPGRSFEVVQKVWGENRAKEFQRMVILKARPLTKSTDQSADLEFMLACLENPVAQREACLALGKGNGLERELGARRLALLEANPQLQSN